MPAILKQKMVVDKITKDTPDTVTLTLTGKEKLDFKPGQFIMIEILGEEKTPKRAYSLSSSPTRNENLEITIKEMADGWISKIVCDMEGGEEMNVDGPYGHFVFDPETMSEIVLIGAGSGVAPYRSFCHYIIDKELPTKVTFVYSNKTEEDIIFHQQLLEFEKQIEGMELILTLSREEKEGFRQGRIDEALVKEIVSKKPKAHYFICGPPKMVNGTKELLLANKIEKDQIKIEVYG